MAEINLLKSESYKNDIERCLLQFSQIGQIKNKSFFITGCNGLICSAVVDLLIQADKQLNLNIQLYLASRNI